MITRRDMIRLGGLSVLAFTAVEAATEGTSAAADPKRLDNRLELWANYARRTKENLLARLTTTRETSLLDAPLVTTGMLAFRAPDVLVLRDDGLSGSTTLIDGGVLAIEPNQPNMPRGPHIDPQRSVAAAWLADRLVRCFAPPEQSTALVEGARVHVPRGRGYRLELAPPRGSVVRQLLRNLSIHLDPMGGAVTQIVIAEAQGDRVRLALSDLRQNVDEGDITRVVDEARTLAKTR